MTSSLTALPFKIFNAHTSTQIIFNNTNDSNFKKTDQPGAYILTLDRADPEGIGNNQAAEVDDGNVQPLGIVEGTYVVKGFITNMRGQPVNNPTTPNPFLTLLRTWKDGPQVVVNTYEAGVFGIEDSSDPDNDIDPDDDPNTLGLIFENYQKINDYNRDRVDITLTFRRSRGLDI